MLKLTLLQANQLPGNAVKSYKSKVYFIPKSDGLGIIGMGEFAVSFDLSGEFFDEKGRSAPLVQIAEALERAFNFSFGGIYKNKTALFRRKPFNRTKGLDYLRNLIIREGRNRSKNKDEKR
ncbi:hypothetical protein EZS27_020702 [termite gut metagenome]|uniref:Uncharacterized protein n=1 Tax=termite gut metagenome TaxID=433724 RepID=A0A5J4RCZ6_9ZZZZ